MKQEKEEGLVEDESDGEKSNAEEQESDEEEVEENNNFQKEQKEKEENNNDKKENLNKDLGQEEEEYLDELNDKFDVNLHLTNKQFKAYRDLAVGEEQDEEQDSDSDNYSCTTTTSTIMDPHMVRAKVRKGLLKKIKTEKRRIRNKGESSLVTQKNREINDTIKSSMNFFKLNKIFFVQKISY